MPFLMKLVNMHLGKQIWKLLCSLREWKTLFLSAQLFINPGNVLFSCHHGCFHANKRRLDGQDF